jgi:hypothetical protein
MSKSINLTTTPATKPAAKPAVTKLHVIIDSCFKSDAEKGTKGYLRGSALFKETRTCVGICLEVDANAFVVPLTTERLAKLRESYATKHPEKRMLWTGIEHVELGKTVFEVGVDEDNRVVKVDYQYPKVDQKARANEVAWDEIFDNNVVTDVLNLVKGGNKA